MLLNDEDVTFSSKSRFFCDLVSGNQPFAVEATLIDAMPPFHPEIIENPLGHAPHIIQLSQNFDLAPVIFGLIGEAEQAGIGTGDMIGIGAGLGMGMGMATTEGILRGGLRR